MVDPSESCDDGNTVDGDGCSATCASDESCGNTHADFDTRIADVDTYLRLLVATRGSIALRVAYFERRYALPAEPPPLDELLATIRALG